MEDTELLIWKFIERNWVVSFATCNNDQLWAANAFYIADRAQKSLFLLTNKETKHGKMLLQNPKVAGTISHQENDVSQLQGLQFEGTLSIVGKEKSQHFFDQYCERFPIAKTHAETIWQLQFSLLKYTDNSLGFGTKLYWPA